MTVTENPRGNGDWTCAPPRVAIKKDEAHVWRIGLDLPSTQRDNFFEVLSIDERDRAARFRFDRDRDHFIVARGGLRQILGAYLEVPAGDVEFGYSRFGKPRLAAGREERDIRFNVSHSGGLAIVGVSEGREIGVDVEQIRSDFDVEAIAERFFSLAEQAALRQLPREQKYEGFYACWTRKEACIKAVGQGLSLPLDSFDVALAPGLPVAILSARNERLQPSQWWLEELGVGAGYAAALAIAGPASRVQLWDYGRPAERDEQ